MGVNERLALFLLSAITGPLVLALWELRRRLNRVTDRLFAISDRLEALDIKVGRVPEETYRTFYQRHGPDPKNLEVL